MAGCSSLVVVGRVDDKLPKEKLEKLLYHCLVSTFGSEASAVDAEFAQLTANLAKATVAPEYGLTVTAQVGASHLVRVQYQPTAEQFRAALRESMTHALNVGRANDTEISVDGRVHVAYTGQVMARSGDWLLANCALPGHQVLSWLDGEAARAWWPQLDKFPYMDDKLHVSLFTPLAGADTSWPMNKNGHPITLLSQVDVRLVRVTLSIEASWRANGKAVTLDAVNSASYDGLRGFIQVTLDQSPVTTIEHPVNQDAPLGCALSAQRPALYLFPGGGLTNQASALFSLQGFTMLVGGSFAAATPPAWWAMVRNLPRLDAFVAPDWSASNLLSYNFIHHLIEFGSEAERKMFGELLVPPPPVVGSQEAPPGAAVNDMLLSAPATLPSHNQTSPWVTGNTASTSANADALPAAIVLFAKLGWGELRLQPLSQRTGVLVFWQSGPTGGVGGVNGKPPLRLLFPSVQLPSGVSATAAAIQGLDRLMKSLASVTQLKGPSLGRTSGMGATRQPGKRPLTGTSTTTTPARPMTAKPTPPRPAAPTRPTTANPSARPRPSAPAKLQPSAPRTSTIPPTSRTSAAKPQPETTTKKPTPPAPKRPITAAPTMPKRTSAPITESKPPTTRTTLPSKPTPKPLASKLTPTTKAPTAPSRPAPLKTTTSTAERLKTHSQHVASKQPPARPSTMTKKTNESAKPTTKPVGPPKIPEAKEPSPMLSKRAIDTVTGGDAEPTLRDSLELSSLDPLVSGWHANNNNDNDCPPDSSQTLLPSTEPEAVIAQLPSVDVVSTPEKPEEPNFDELYRVHKFEHLDEADETAVDSTSASTPQYEVVASEPKLDPTMSPDMPSPIDSETKHMEVEQHEQEHVPVRELKDEESEAEVKDEKEAFVHDDQNDLPPQSVLQLIDPAVVRSYQDGLNLTETGHVEPADDLGHLGHQRGDGDQIDAGFEEPAFMDNSLSRNNVDLSSRPPMGIGLEDEAEVIAHASTMHAEPMVMSQTDYSQVAAAALMEPKWFPDEATHDPDQNVLIDDVVKSEAHPSVMSEVVDTAIPLIPHPTHGSDSLDEDEVEHFDDDVRQQDQYQSDDEHGGDHHDDVAVVVGDGKLMGDMPTDKFDLDGHHELGLDRQDDVEQDQKHDVEQNRHHDVEQDLQHDVEQDRHHDVEQDRQHDVEQDQHHDVEQDQHHDVEQDRHHDVEQDQHHDVEQDRHHDVEQDRQHEFGLDQLDDTGLDQHRELGLDEHHDTGHDDDDSDDKHPHDMHHDLMGSDQDDIMLVHQLQQQAQHQLPIDSVHDEHVFNVHQFQTETPIDNNNPFHAAAGATEEVSSDISDGESQDREMSVSASRIQPIESPAAFSPLSPIINTNPFEMGEGVPDNDAIQIDPMWAHPIESHADQSDHAARVPADSLDVHYHQEHDDVAWAAAQFGGADQSLDGEVADSTTAAVDNESFVVDEMQRAFGHETAEKDFGLHHFQSDALSIDPTGDHMEGVPNPSSPMSEASVDSVVHNVLPSSGHTDEQFIGHSVADSQASLGNGDGLVSSTSPGTDDPYHLHHQGLMDSPQFDPFQQQPDGNELTSVSPSQHTNHMAPPPSSHLESGFANGDSIHPDADVAPAMFKFTQESHHILPTDDLLHSDVPTAFGDHPLDLEATTAAATMPKMGLLDFSQPMGDQNRSPLDASPADEASGFDPLQNWGQPRGLPPPPGPKARTPGSKPMSGPPARNTTGRTTTGAANGKSNLRAPPLPTLSPGPAVFMDLAFVPPYVARVPQAMAAEFFARVRARVYIISGEALHPTIGEALLEGKAKWDPKDVETLCSHWCPTGEAPVITLLPTDDPYEWSCWLRTPCGRPDKETGEARLQTNGIRVLPSASLCDIEYSAGNVAFRSEGVRVDF